MKIVKNVHPPSGVSRALFRAPIYLYRLGLGWLFGKRILLLNHIGRVSGKQRQVILEVVEHDPTNGTFVVASGWGPTAAWYRNILHRPQVSVQVGRRTIPVTVTTPSTSPSARSAGAFRLSGTKPRSMRTVSPSAV